MLHQGLLLFAGRPVALAIAYLLVQLGIQLLVVDGGAEVDVAGDRHADEAACSAGVCERHRLVGGAYERGEAAVLRIGLAVGWTVFQVGSADD